MSSRLLSKNLKIKIYKTIILPVVLYGCETWPLKLREECSLRILENKILRRIFGPKRDANGKLHSLYRSPNIVRVIKSRRLRWAGHVARVEEGKNALKSFTGKPTGKRPLWRSWRRQEDNIRMNLEEICINAGN